MLRALLIACLLFAAPVALAGSYADYARELLADLPEGITTRPDLEDYLSAKASAYRRKNRRSVLAASDQLTEAARAQAYDMMILGRSGHRSRSGASFTQRFKAFQEEPGLTYPAGENAASDRRRGAADEAKADRLFKLWIGSGGHRQNLLKENWAHVSTGVIQRGSELWVVQIFWGEPVKTNFTIGIQ